MSVLPFSTGKHASKYLLFFFSGAALSAYTVSTTELQRARMRQKGRASGREAHVPSAWTQRGESVVWEVQLYTPLLGCVGFQSPIPDTNVCHH